MVKKMHGTCLEYRVVFMRDALCAFLLNELNYE